MYSPQQHVFERLRVITQTAWVAEDFAAAKTLPVILDYGFDAPPALNEAWWCAGAYVNRCLVTDGVRVPDLASPDHHFLDRVPGWFTRRRVITRTIAEWRQVPDPGAGFVKMPLMKQALFPATVFGSMAEALERVAAHYQATDSALVEEMLLQFSDPVVFATEFRCFIADGRVTAASFYLETIRDHTGAVVEEITWSGVDEADARGRASDAIAFATSVISDLEHAPAGYTLDVGQLNDGTWAVVEANAAWSSNPYHSASAGAIESVLASQRPGGAGQWAWRPERAFLARVNPFR